MPNGFVSFGETYDYHLFELRDSRSNYFSHIAQFGHKKNEKQFTELNKVFETEKECIDYLKSIIIHILRKEGYTGSREEKIKKSYKKVWYK